MGHKHKHVAEFTLEGRFLGFVVEDGHKLKRIRLHTAAGEQSIKLSKDVRASLATAGIVLRPGDWLKVSGESKTDSEDGTKLKAYQIIPTSPKAAGNPEDEAIAPPEVALCPAEVAHSVPKKATILVCQKSDCMKRGGRATCAALETALRDRGLADQVVIRGTGCMKQCKAGPNLVMPDKSRYSQVRASEIETLVDRHFPAALPVQIG